MSKYFKDCTLEEMFKHHDHTYCMSDDFRAYENGSRQRNIMFAKVEEHGGWTQELVDLYNSYAPQGMFQMDYSLLSNTAEQSSWSARQAHNLEVGGQNPPSATNIKFYNYE